ncbi:MAG: nucleotidyltransferase domain-containing protein [Candidatus Bathyarchaeia archaeon]
MSKVEEALNGLAKSLKEAYGPVEIYLFGSFAKGDWLEDSDIDVIVVSEKFEGKPMPERVNIIRKLAPDNLAFEILAYTPKELKEATAKSIIIQDASTYWKRVV